MSNFKFRNLGIILLILSLFILGACNSKDKKEDSKKSNSNKKSSGEVSDATGEASDATGEADIKSATAEAKIKDGTEGLGKKEFIFKVPVSSQKLVRGEMKSFLSGNGRLAPEEQILIRAEISGKLTYTRDWKEGDPVKQGTIIATIDNEEVRYLKTESQDNLKLAEERVPPALEKRNLARRNLESKKRLLDEGVISQLDYDQADVSRMDSEISYKQALAEVESRKTELEKVKYKQDRAILEAPFDGVLVRKEYLEPKQGQTSYPILSLNGRTISTGESLFGIIKTSSLLLNIDVSSKEIGKVAPGQTVEVHVYGSEVIEVTGIVTKISTTLDPITGAFKVNTLIENPVGAPLRSGIFCKVDIVIERKQDSISVPKEVVQTRNNRKVVFVVAGEDPDYQAEEREVTIGISNRYDVEIASGLHEGDLLIVRGYETLKDKTKIKLAGIDEDQAEESKEDLSKRETGS